MKCIVDAFSFSREIQCWRKGMTSRTCWRKGGALVTWNMPSNATPQYCTKDCHHAKPPCLKAWFFNQTSCTMLLIRYYPFTILVSSFGPMYWDAGAGIMSQDNNLQLSPRLYGVVCLYGKFTSLGHSCIVCFVLSYWSSNDMVDKGTIKSSRRLVWCKHLVKLRFEKERSIKCAWMFWFDFLQVSKETGEATAAIQEEASAILEEMAHRLQLSTVRFFAFALTKAFKTLFRSINVNEEGIQRVSLHARRKHNI